MFLLSFYDVPVSFGFKDAICTDEFCFRQKPTGMFPDSSFHAVIVSQFVICLMSDEHICYICRHSIYPLFRIISSEELKRALNKKQAFFCL